MVIIFCVAQNVRNGANLFSIDWLIAQNDALLAEKIINRMKNYVKSCEFKNKKLI